MLCKMRVSLLMLFSCTEVFRRATGQRRIVGGRDAEDGMFPYAVSVITEGRGSCTGSLLSESWVLTAAHCIPTSPCYRLRIAAGAANKRSINAQVRYAEELKVHDWYQKNTLAAYDIALVKVDPPFNMSSSHIGNVSLSSREWPQAEVSCTALGWGRRHDSGMSSDVLQYLEVTAKHGVYGCPCVGRSAQKRLICLEGAEGEGPCRGDSGGPLVCDGEVVGVTHMGFDRRGCNPPVSLRVHCGRKETVVTYMYVCPQLDWIRKYVPGVPPTPASCLAALNRQRIFTVFIFSIFLFTVTINI